MDKILDYAKIYRKEIFFFAYFLLALNIVYVIYADYSDREIANIKREIHLMNVLIKIKSSNGMIEEDKTYKKALRNLEEFRGSSLTDEELININTKAQTIIYEREETEN